MNRDSEDDSIYRSCIAWNVPAIRRSGNGDAIAFMETLQLLPGTVGSPSTDEYGARIPPLRRAALGLQAEISGNAELAREHYERIGRLAGARGVLGRLLIAWMSEATQEDFDHVERRLRRLAGPGVRDLIARSHTRLASWALDHGWPDVADHHFGQAQDFAGKELNAQLGQIGHLFGRRQEFAFRTKRSDMIRFPWIVDFMDDAARASVEDRFKESFKSPWTRTWSFGGLSGEGTAIQSAEMQVSWAGALWLLPTVQRQHAALILDKSREPSDITRAIALWVRGQGNDSGRLAAAFEGRLTAETVSDLLLNKLHSGRSTRPRKPWLDLCHALWSELPETLIEDIVMHYGGPAPGLLSHTDEASELSLFSKIVTRSSYGVAKLESLTDEQLALVLRTMPPESVELIDLVVLKRGISSALARANDEWSDIGWPTLARAWSLLSEPDREEFRERLLGAVPSWQIPAVANAAPDLVPRRMLKAQLEVEIERVRQDISNANRGIFTGGSTEPSMTIAWIAHKLGEFSEATTTSLIDLACDRRVDSDKRQSALTALKLLAREGAIDDQVAAPAFGQIEADASSFMIDDAPADQRYENLQRTSLQLAFRYSNTHDGQLLAAARDPNVRVRQLAIATVQSLSLAGSASPALDGALLGALYDPDPSVQAAAVPAIWRGSFDSSVVCEAARQRIVELWPSAPLEFRLAIAREVAANGRRNELLDELRTRCSLDRSFLVRGAADRTP